MILPRNPRELAVDLLPRSECSVQVAAVVCDASGNLISWGWNNSGRNGLGQHAEAHALSRSNQSRLWYGTIYVAAKRRRPQKSINSKPCPKCQALIHKWHMETVYRDKALWETIRIKPAFSL